MNINSIFSFVQNPVAIHRRSAAILMQYPG